MGFHTRYKNLSVGLRVNNLGKEFAENTSIPTTIGVGLKYNIISGTRLLAEVEIPDLQINGGIIYAYKTMKLLLGLRYLGARDMVNGMSISRGSDDLGVTAGLMVDIDNYTIGYSVVYGHFSVAHHFSVSFVP
jgi:hypothetical protein